MRNDTTYLVTFNCGGRDVPRIAIEAVLYSARDWLRWADGTYLIRSNLHSSVWLEKIRPVLAEGDDVFIAALDPNNRVGWMKPLALDWITRDAIAIPSGS